MKKFNVRLTIYSDFRFVRDAELSLELDANTKAEAKEILRDMVEDFEHNDFCHLRDIFESNGIHVEKIDEYRRNPGTPDPFSKVLIDFVEEVHGHFLPEFEYLNCVLVNDGKPSIVELHDENKVLAELNPESFGNDECAMLEAGKAMAHAPKMIEILKDIVKIGPKDSALYRRAKAILESVGVIRRDE